MDKSSLPSEVLVQKKIVWANLPLKDKPGEFKDHAVVIMEVIDDHTFYVCPFTSVIDLKHPKYDLHLTGQKVLHWSRLHEVVTQVDCAGEIDISVIRLATLNRFGVLLDGEFDQLYDNIAAYLLEKNSKGV